MYQLRPFNTVDAEYQAVAQFLTLAQPENRRPVTVESLQEDDSDWEDGYLNQRFVVEDSRSETNERLVLVGTAMETFWAYRPGEVHLKFDVHPDHGGRGVEDLFYEYIVQALSVRTPKLERLLIGVMEDNVDRVAYVESKGFTVRERDTKSALLLENADLSPLAGLESAALADGIHIYTLAQVKELVPDWKVQLHQLRSALDQDVPGAGPKMETTLDQFERMFLQDPALDPEAWWIAVDERSIPTSPHVELASSDAALSNILGSINNNKDKDHVHRDHLDLAPKSVGRFIGYSNLWINDETRKRLDTGMTGVLRSHRRRGIATLLKYKAIAYGKRHNSERIVTSNEENNPMLDLNYKLGFEPIPGWIRYEKNFQTEQEQQKASTA